MFNDRELSNLRALTSQRAVAGAWPPQHYNEGWRQECKMIAERLSPENNEVNDLEKIPVVVEPS
jgi:uncharacterized protein (DUF2164 family)